MAKDDEVHLRLTIDVHYELGRTSVQDLEKVLVAAAEHLAKEELLSGKTEASVLTWGAEVFDPAVQSELKWTKKSPEEPGWYWVRSIEGDIESRIPRIEHVYKIARGLNAGKLSMGMFSGKIIFVDTFKDLEWAGPILLPNKEEKRSENCE